MSESNFESEFCEISKNTFFLQNISGGYIWMITQKLSVEMNCAIIITCRMVQNANSLQALQILQLISQAYGGVKLQHKARYEWNIYDKRRASTNFLLPVTTENRFLNAIRYYYIISKLNIFCTANSEFWVVQTRFFRKQCSQRSQNRLENMYPDKKVRLK